MEESNRSTMQIYGKIFDWKSYDGHVQKARGSPRREMLNRKALKQMDNL